MLFNSRFSSTLLVITHDSEELPQLGGWHVHALDGPPPRLHVALKLLDVRVQDDVEHLVECRCAVVADEEEETWGELGQVDELGRGARHEVLRDEANGRVRVQVSLVQVRVGLRVRGRGLPQLLDVEDSVLQTVLDLAGHLGLATLALQKIREDALVVGLNGLLHLAQHAAEELELGRHIHVRLDGRRRHVIHL